MTYSDFDNCLHFVVETKSVHFRRQCRVEQDRVDKGGENRVEVSQIACFCANSWYFSMIKGPRKRKITKKKKNEGVIKICNCIQKQLIADIT